MRAGESFFSLYSHDLVRVAVATPEVRVADPSFNARQTIEAMRRATQQHAILLLFPELGLSAYSCEDLFQQRVLLDGASRRSAKSRLPPRSCRSWPWSACRSRSITSSTTARS